MVTHSNGGNGMTSTYQGTADQTLDSRDLIAYAEDEDNRLEDPDTCAEIDQLADEGIEDWEYGAQFIREDYFTEYAQEFAEDIGAIAGDAQWPTYCIDWERAARELAMDYTTVEYLGHTYYVR